MNRPAQKPQPTVEQMLTSIRQAIHGANVPDLSGGQAVRRAEPRAAKPPKQRERNGSTLEDVRRKLDGLDPLSRPRNGSHSTSATGFAGILSGNVKLDEALAKLKRAGLGDEPNVVNDRVTETDLEDVGAYAFADDDDFADMARLDDDFPVDPLPPQEPERFSEETRARYLAPEPIVEEEPVSPPVSNPPPAPPAPEPERGLTSDASAKAASDAFNKLAETIVARASTGQRSIDDITRELLRPMLQTWLDNNLPDMVERLVREEISRVARWGQDKR